MEDFQKRFTSLLQDEGIILSRETKQIGSVFISLEERGVLLLKYIRS